MQAAQDCPHDQSIQFIGLCWLFRFFGILNFLGSIWFALSSKTDISNLRLFWACFSVLSGVSFLYLVGRCISEKWRSSAMRLNVTPYLVGTTVWVVFIPILMILRNS